MTKLANPIRPLLVLAALAAVALPASGCGTTHRRPRPRPRPLRRKVRRLPHDGPGRHDAPRSAPTSTTPSPRRGQPARAATRSKAWSRPRSSTRGRATATRRSRCPPTSSTGQDLDDVAAYVGLYAGVPGAAPPKVPGGPGAQVFANNGCGGCHTLAAAKSGGVTGPNLDEVLPGQSAAMIERVDRRPQRQDRQGLPGQRDAGQLRTKRSAPKEIEDLVKYLIESTGGSAARAKAGGSKPKGG